MEELNHLEVMDERNENDIVNVPERRTNILSSGELNLVAVEEERNEDDGINVPEYLEIINSPSFELKREKIKIERLLGSGEFGEVYKATLDNDTVAVKSLKGETFHITLSLWGAASTLAMTMRVVESAYSFKCSMFGESKKTQLNLRFKIRLFSMQNIKLKPVVRIEVILVITKQQNNNNDDNGGVVLSFSTVIFFFI